VNDLFGWRLPDKDELNLMYVNLKEQGLGGFANDVYWSATELGGGYGVWTQNFRDGSPWANTIGPSGSAKDRTWSVRAIRAF
jgi:hypothetical protein